MTTDRDGRRGVVVYTAVAIVGATALAAWQRVMQMSVEDNRAAVFVLAVMWIPALARFVATRTVDRGWQPPFPLRRWGEPRLVVVLVPLAIVSAIYLGAYGLAWLIGVPLGAPAWTGRRLALNLAVNLPLLAAIGCSEVSVRRSAGAGIYSRAWIRWECPARCSGSSQSRRCFTPH